MVWFIGAANRQCNLMRLDRFKILVFFYNFRGCDAHFIKQEFKTRPDSEINLIGQNIGKYFQVESRKNMVFRDFLQLMPAFLEQFAVSLVTLAADIFKNSTTLSRMCIQNKTLSCSSKRESSATTTSTFSRGSMNPHYRYEGLSLTSLKTLSAHRRNTRTISTCDKTSTARISKSTWRPIL